MPASDLLTHFRCPKVMSVGVRCFSTPVKRGNKSTPDICSIWGEPNVVIAGCSFLKHSIWEGG